MLSRTSLRVARKMGPSPSAGMDVEMGSLRPSSFAFWEMSEPMRPPPMTMVSALRREGVRVVGTEGLVGANPWEVQMDAVRVRMDVSGEHSSFMVDGFRYG